MTDQVDSVKVVTDESGLAVRSFEYFPYGSTWFQQKARDSVEEFLPKYNSQEFDKETGFYYYNARYYEPEISRFVTADNVIDGEYSISGWNRYMYVKGNPVVYKDPTGHNALQYYGQAMMRRMKLLKSIKQHYGEKGLKEFNQGENKGLLEGAYDNTLMTPLRALASFAGCPRDLYKENLKKLKEQKKSLPYQLGYIKGYKGAETLATAAAGVVASGAAVNAASKVNSISNLFTKNGLKEILARAKYSYGKQVRKGTRNPTVKKAIEKGKKMHKSYDYGPGVKKEVRLPSGKRMDGYNSNKRIIHELKPNNQRAIKKGIKQLDNYIDEANKYFGPGHSGKIHTYD